MSEKSYDFRKFLDEVHQQDLRDFSLRPHADETEITSDWIIRIPENASGFLQGTARDLADYLFKSMDVGVRIARGGSETDRTVELKFDSSLKVKRSFRLQCDERKIVIEGADERGIAMGCYYLEDVMTLRESPFVSHTAGQVREPLFSPRMVHSAYGMDVFTKPYLKRIAHAGFDTILIFVKDDLLHGHNGPFDFAPLIDQAEAAGLDVYLYAAIKNLYHPSDPEADAFYEANYGGLFKRYPKAKGLVLVGESCQFPSHDPHTTQSITGKRECCFRPVGKSMPGWWPCEDFPEFVDLVKSKVRKYAPEADIVFWTYNWPYAPADLRTGLIDRLPKDITVEVNYELHDNVRIWGTQERALDYTLSLTGPSRLFREESSAVKRNGQRLCAMSNTAGKTWDIGAVPYLPALHQWGKRMTNLLADRDAVGVNALMESHHFGWYPSIVSELGKMLFWSNGPTLDEALKLLAVRDFSEETADEVIAVWKDWSSALASFITPIEDQYGPCRVGPSYPFLFKGVSLRQTFGMNFKFPWTVFCRYQIAFPEYTVVNDPDGLDFGTRRAEKEIRHLPEAIRLWKDGADRIEKLLPRIPSRKHDKAVRMTGVARYIANTLTTTWNIKRWWLENNRLLSEADAGKSLEILSRIEQIAKEEIENAKNTIPLVEYDSSLGYEPSMDYVADREHLEWKIRQLTSVLEVDILNYRKGIEIAEKIANSNK